MASSSTASPGAHRVYFNPADQRRTVVPWKSPGSTLPYGTLKAILDDLGWSAEDLKRLRLI